jgi:twinkle protein
MVDTEDFGEAQEKDQGFTPKGITEGVYQPWRGVTEATMEHFGVTTQGDHIAFVYPSGGVKKRLKSDKRFYAENLKSDELFGMQKFPAGCSRKVTITEGEMDALSAWQMLQNGNYINPVVSLPSANPSGKLWEKCKGWLDSFDEIILSVDNDEPGRKVAEKVSLMFPGKVKVMDHGQHKDANDFLMNGDGRAYKSAWWSARAYKPDDMLVDAQDYLDLYDESPDFEYFETGIPELDEKILGINKGYFTVIQAPTGVGKTEIMRYFEYQCLTKSNYKFAFMHLEESKLRSVLGLVSYELKDNLTLKKFIENKGREDDVRNAIEKLTESERMMQFSFRPEDGYEDLLEKIKFFKAAFDIDFVFFEPIQDLVNGEDKEGKLADLSSRLGTMASELDVGIITIAHQNQNGDTMYATMIGKKAAFEILLQRDQEADDPQERNRTYVRVGRKNRVGLGNGPAGALDFDHESFTLTPVMPPMAPTTPDRKDDF